MNYETAQKLKDAVFPLTDIGERINKHYKAIPIAEDGTLWNEVIPTLSELIEACGDRFWRLEREIGVPNNFIASGHDKDGEYLTTSMNKCSTPEEAVANLWLELNK